MPDKKPVPPAAPTDAQGNPKVTVGIPLETIDSAEDKAAGVVAATETQAVVLADKVEARAVTLADKAESRAIRLALATQKRDLEVDHVLADHTARLGKIDASITEVVMGLGVVSVATGRIEAHLTTAAELARSAEEARRFSRSFRISVFAALATAAAVSVTILSLLHVIH